jgi:hypothetical protein
VYGGIIRGVLVVLQSRSKVWKWRKQSFCCMNKRAKSL